MKLALHRSVTFWSGLLVMAFICWAWRDSERFYTKASYQHVTAENCWGGLLVFYNIPRLSARFEFIRHLKGVDLLDAKVLPAPEFLQAGDITEGQEDEIFNRVIVHGDDGKVTGHFELCTMREYMVLFVDSVRPGSSGLFLPYWLILLAVALPWTALLLWRARRRKRAVEKNPELALS